MKNRFFKAFPVILPLLVLITFAAVVYYQPKAPEKINRFMLNRTGLQKEPGFLPNDWLARQRAYPQGRIKTESFLTAVREARDMHENATRSTYNWELAGPTNIGGRITDIEMPAGSTSVIYVGAASGGIFKTEDEGTTWTNIFDHAATISIGDLAIGPNNTNLIYAGTGEANASSQSFRGDGIYKSTDGGETWNHSGLDESAYIGRIIIDYENEQRVFVAACGNLFSPDEHRGIYRTTNGGENWENVLFLSDSTSGIDLVQHPSNPDILYAAMWERMRGLNYRRSFGHTSGIWMTTDRGDNWTELTVGLPSGSGVGRIGLAISASNPSVLYAFYDNQSEVAVYKTSNGGAAWTRTNDNAIQGMNSSFGWYFGQIRVHPQNENRIYLLGVDLFSSENGGNSYVQLAGYYNSDEIHVDHHAMYIHPETGRIYEGNDGGFYISDNLGYVWTWINNIPITQFYDIEIDYLNPQRLIGGTQDNNTIRTSYGDVDGWDPILGGDGFYALVDYTRSNVVYAEYQWGMLHKSNNYGNSMSYIGNSWYNDRVNWSAPVIMHPENPNILYFGTYRVWKSTNGGNLWSAVSYDLTKGDDGSTFHTISTLGISPVDPTIVLSGSDDGLVHISTDGGLTWTNISAGLPDRWITRVSADPFDANTIYVTCSGFRWDEPLPHIYRSTNLGQTWEPISSNLPEIPVNAFIADPTRQGRYFAGTDAGMFMSPDYGVNWISLNQGLGNVPVTTMKLHDTEEVLVIGTYGLSAYRLDLSELTVDVAQTVKPSSTLLINKIYPQPFLKNPEANIMMEVSSGVETSAVIEVFNLNGQKIFSETKIKLKAGVNNLSLNYIFQSAMNLKAGSYFVRVQSGSTQTTGKILIL
ncbi:MAG: T9SS type A sorting domain-containing protein [Lentimicrobium sp.]|nr:T9SS type A sorting domain-containing protein [Lentimicrobium sp.]